MSDEFFVDTNILMYAHDASAGAKHERAKAADDARDVHESGNGATEFLERHPAAVGGTEV